MVGFHRDHGHFDAAQWRKRILLPCWGLQVVILLGMTGLFSYRLSHTLQTWKDEELRGQIPAVEFVWEGVNIGFSVISFVINLIQIAKFIAEALTPFGMIVGNIVSLVLSLGILALDIVVYIQHADKQYSLIGIIMDAALIVFTLLPTLYSVYVYRRISALSDYHLPHNAKHYGFTNDRDLETSYDASRLSINIHQSEPALWDPMGSNSEPRRLSLSFRRNSAGSSRPTSVVSVQQPELERRSSYNHKRDTQFDEFVAKRQSQPSARVTPPSSVHTPEEVDRAVRAEFGWDDDQGKRQSIVSMGTVPSAHARPRGASLTRAASWEVNFGEEVTTPDGQAQVQRGHSLHSVPEGPEPEEARLAAAEAAEGAKDKGKGKARATDEQATLLAGGDQEDIADRRLSYNPSAAEEIELDVRGYPRGA